MAFNDLRSYLDWLEEDNQMVRVNEPVSVRFDIARHEEKHDGKKTVFFENVKDYDMPVVGNILNNRRNIARVLGTAEGPELSHRIIAAAGNPLPTKLVENAPFKEVRFVGPDVDLLKQIPNPKQMIHLVHLI